MTLISPELGVSGNLATLTTAGPAGRYLSPDSGLPGKIFGIGTRQSIISARKKLRYQAVF
jgi:hypothetical protein